MIFYVKDQELLEVETATTKKNLAKKISEINKNASIILTVCDPVARLWSDWLSLQEQVENNLSLNGTGDLDRDSDYNDSDYRVVLLKF